MNRFLIPLICILAQSLSGADLQPLSPAKFTGVTAAPENISAVAVIGNGGFLVIGGDEGAEIEVLRRTGDGEYTADHHINLADADTEEEIDVEGIAYSDGRLYVAASHSRKRSKIKAGELTRKENRERLKENNREPLREKLFELRLSDNGVVDGTPEIISLRQRIENDPVLAPFLQIPSKENGIDIEGIAAVGDELYVGFRGPVLREGYVPVLVFDFDEPNKAKTRYVSLGGRGIRDMIRVSDGFLLIGGPVGEEPVSYEIYQWDGKDCIAGTDAPDPQFPKSLGVIPLPDQGAKAEGIAVLEETETHYDVLIVFDGPRNGVPSRFRVTK